MIYAKLRSAESFRQAETCLTAFQQIVLSSLTA